MPGWGEILTEIGSTKSSQGIPDTDAVRRKYLGFLHNHTERNIILYATNCTSSLEPGISPELISICNADIQALMAVMQGLDGNKGLDLILHSPGGSPFAAEWMVKYLRSKFEHIRVIVPQMAMSAATMISCAADVIMLGKQSALGPIDPQFTLQTSLGVQSIPAYAIREQFNQAVRECSDSSKMAAWLPMLSQYGPALLIECDNAIKVSQEMVNSWLQTYMFKNDLNKEEKARQISEWLADHGMFKNHGRFLPRDLLLEKGLKIENLEDNQTTQDLVLSIFHAATHTFTFSQPTKKIVENHLGNAYIIQAGSIVVSPQLQAEPERKPPHLQLGKPQKKKR